MLLFIRSVLKRRSAHWRFNTSHVTLYLLCSGLCIWVCGKFQYISCYSLSVFFFSHSQTNRGFNTSHVTLYLGVAEKYNSRTGFQYISCYSLSSSRWESGNQNMVSIHLMLLFITNREKKRRCRRAVSIHLMLLFIQVGNRQKSAEEKFQYISCYSLSTAVLNGIQDLVEFQYISCYSLSWCRKKSWI